MSAAPARITRVRFAGLRTAADVELDLEGLTVLIGPNGVGKSTLVEGFELLRRVTAGDDFVQALHDDHGGPPSLVRYGAKELKLGIDITLDGESFSYEMALGTVAGGFGIAHESLRGRDLIFLRSDDRRASGAPMMREASASMSGHEDQEGLPDPAAPPETHTVWTSKHALTRGIERFDNAEEVWTATTAR